MFNYLTNLFCLHIAQTDEEKQVIIRSILSQFSSILR